MLKNVFIIMALVAVLLVLQCSDKPTQQQHVKLGDMFTLTPGMAVEIQGEGLVLTFRSVLSDSRCPFGVLCFWQGVAEIEIKLDTKAGDSALVTLGVLGGTRYNAENPYFVDTLGYQLSFLRLDPYPEHASLSRPMTPPQPISEYQATLRIDHAQAIGDLTSSVMITNMPPDSILLDYFAVDSVSIVGDTLSLAVNYGGCCKNHYFFLFMSPASFLESAPTQANLYLRHFANNDLCECLEYRTLKFDLRPVADLYLQVYGVAEPIALNLSEFTGSIPDRSFRVIYYPTGAQHNRAPVLAEIGSKSIECGDTLRFAVPATDSDGTTPSVFAVNLPRNASLMTTDSGSSVFSFSPDTSQIGVHNILLYASDGELADSEVVDIMVTEAKILLPKLQFFGSRSVVVGGTLALDVLTSGGSGTALVITASGLPENTLFTQVQRTLYKFIFTPDSSQVGDHNILFVASDGSLADSESVTIRVGSTSLLIPTAVGNNWRYEIFSLDSAGGIAAAIGDVHITGSIVDDNGSDIWWNLSNPIPPFTNQFMVRQDSVFSESGLEFIRATDEPISYYVTSTPWLDQSLSSVPRVASRLDSMITMAGIFRNCCYYERRVCDTSSAAITCYDETYVIAPGVGIIEIGFEKSATLPATSYRVMIRWQLIGYELE